MTKATNPMTIAWISIETTKEDTLWPDCGRSPKSEIVWGDLIAGEFPFALPDPTLHG